MVLVGLPVPPVHVYSLIMSVSVWPTFYYDKEKEPLEKLLLIYKEANETFNGILMIEHLANEVKYWSQDMYEEKIGIDEVARYLVDRFKYFEEKKDTNPRLLFKGYAPHNMPCLVINIDGENKCFVSFKVNEKQKIIDIFTTTAVPPVDSVKIVDKYDCEISDKDAHLKMAYLHD